MYKISGLYRGVTIAVALILLQKHLWVRLIGPGSTVFRLIAVRIIFFDFQIWY